MDITQMIAVIQCYIHIRKGVEVHINPQSAMMRPDLLMSAFNTAEQWFSQNNGSIAPIR